MRPQQVSWASRADVVLHGRNGTGLGAGLRVTRTDNMITLMPLTRRDWPANSHINVPMKGLPAMMKALWRTLPGAVRQLR